MKVKCKIFKSFEYGSSLLKLTFVFYVAQQMRLHKAIRSISLSLRGGRNKNIVETVWELQTCSIAQGWEEEMATGEAIAVPPPLLSISLTNLS